MMMQVEPITKIVKLNFKTHCKSQVFVIDAYILVRGTITIEPQEREYPNDIDKEVLFKKFALFTDCVGRIKNTEIVNAKDIDVVMAMFNLIKYSESYSKR